MEPGMVAVAKCEMVSLENAKAVAKCGMACFENVKSFPNTSFLNKNKRLCQKEASQKEHKEEHKEARPRTYTKSRTSTRINTKYAMNVKNCKNDMINSKMAANTLITYEKSKTFMKQL